MNAFVTDKLNSNRSGDEEPDTKLLNDALSILIDSRDLYSLTEKLVVDEDLNFLFMSVAHDRENTCAYLGNLLVARETQAVQSGTMSGELRKLYSELLSLFDDDSTRMLEQLIHHETRNKELLEEVIYRAKTDFAKALLLEICAGIQQSILTMQTHLDNKKLKDESED